MSVFTTNAAQKHLSAVLSIAAIVLLVVGMFHGAAYVAAAFLCVAAAGAQSRRDALVGLVLCLTLIAMAVAYQAGTSLALQQNQECGLPAVTGRILVTD